MRRPADDKQARCRRAVRSRTQRRAPAGSALEHRRPDRYRAGMAQQSATPLRLIRGPSRFRLAVKPLSGPLRPYGWEIYGDDHGDEPVHRSARRFRTPKEAWEAGSMALDIIQARSLPSPSPPPNDPDGL